MPENMEGADKFSTPYNNSETPDDSKNTDEVTDVNKSEEQVQMQKYEHGIEEEPHGHVPEPEASVSAPASVSVEVASTVRTSHRVKNMPGRYDFPPKVMCITVTRPTAAF